MKEFNNTLNYVAMMTESSVKNVNKLAEAIDYFKNDKIDMDTDIVSNIDKFPDLTAMDKLLLHKSLASDDKFIKKVVMYHKDKGPDFKYYPYMGDVLNELFADEKESKKVAKILSEISSCYKDSISKLTVNKMGEDLIKKVEESFILSPPYLTYLNGLNKTPDVPEVLNEDDGSDYDELTESIMGILSEVSVGDKAKKVVVAVDKKMEAFSNMINKMKAKYEEKAKMDKAEAIVKDSWNLNSRLRRIIKSAPFAIVNPAVGLMVYVTLTAIDKTVDKKVRATYIGDLKLEIRLIDDKIAEAESKGDTKNKAKLIRSKDTLERALEKLQTGKA